MLKHRQSRHFLGELYLLYDPDGNSWAVQQMPQYCGARYYTLPRSAPSGISLLFSIDVALVL